MKLSEAIRQSSDTVKQIPFDLLRSDCERCALGVALKTVRPEITNGEILNKIWFENGDGFSYVAFLNLFEGKVDNLERMVITPFCDNMNRREVTLWRAVEALNDTAKWSLVEIVNWLESIGE